MANALQSLFGGDIAQRWKSARNKYKSSGGTAAPSNVFESLYGATVAAREKFRDGMTTAALATPQGQSVVAEAEKSRIKTYLRNPAVIALLVVVVASIFFAGKKS